MNKYNKKHRNFFKDLYRYRGLWLMVLPAGLLVFIMSYIPMGGIILAFKRFNYTEGIFGSPWVGLENFRFFFISGKAFEVTKNTVLYNSLFIVTGTAACLLVAIVVAEMGGKVFKKAAQSILFLPYFVSWVTVAAFMYNIFNYDTGALNSLFKGLGAQPLDVYRNGWMWYILMPFLNIWKGTGYGSIIYLASIMGLDQECFEAAAVDGANRFQRIRHITLPGITPTIIIMFLLSLGTILRGDFNMFYNLTGSNPMLFKATDIIDTFVFRSLVENPDIGMTAASGVYQSVLCFLIIVTVNKIIKKYQSDYALF